MNQVHIDPAICKGCELCISECPQGILAVSEDTNQAGYHPVQVTDQSKCTGCTLCAQACPDAAIEITRSDDK
jgi:2-oxoglutarate ferredoxin oxidoreductase subunit delta